MIKTLLKHFIFDKCIDVAFEKITNNFINPDIKSDKIKSYLKHMNRKFPFYDFNEVSIITSDRKRRYADVSDIVGDGKYYRQIKFNEISSVEV